MDGYTLLFFITTWALIFMAWSSINHRLSSIRAKQIKLDGWIRSKEERLIK